MQPEKFSRYEIRAELGRGGMATVYRAYDPLFEREIALKILNQDLLDNPQFRERFEREAKIIARLEHPAIVPVYDVGRDNAQMFFVMRYMNGGSLAERMNNGRLPLHETVRILQRIAAGLDYAHGKGVIHRDLKPGNILFDETGNAFISDFGIAKLANAQTRITGTGIIGTPAYMSPEQAQGDDIDGRSDIYSLGIILFEMLSGKVPYEATTPLAMVIKHLQEPVPHILDINPSLPTGIEMVLEKALAKNRILRYATAAELATELSACASEKISPTLEFTRPIQPKTVKAGQNAPPSRWLSILGTIGSLFLLLVIGLFAWQLMNPGIPPAAANSPQPVSLATQTPAIPSAVPSAQTAPSASPSPAATATQPPSPSATADPGIGGADKLVLLTNKDVWQMNLDGTGLVQITNSDQYKFDLQWLPGGKEILYGEGRCVNTVNVQTFEKKQITCLDGANFEGFRVSPDGKLAAITIERRVIVIPFDLDALAKTKNAFDLQNLSNACIDYPDVSVKSTLWSADNKKLALLYQNIRGQRLADIIRVLDISRCKAADPLILDEFPAQRFTPDSYDTYPVLPSYDWDGNNRFLFNTFKRNQGYGDLYIYDMSTNLAKKINPIQNTCCYRDARFSPDGKYILLVFQDVRKGADSQIELYYLPFDQVGTNTSFSPIKLPPLFFPNPREKIAPAPHPNGGG